MQLGLHNVAEGVCLRQPVIPSNVKLLASVAQMLGGRQPAEAVAGVVVIRWLPRFVPQPAVRSLGTQLFILG